MSEKGKISSITKKKGSKEVRISVEQIENGFIVTKNTEWQDPKTGWKYETKKWYSKEDPLEFKDKSLAEDFEE